MTISEERLVELIEGFCAAVLSLSGMVCRAFSVQDLLAGVKSKRIPRAAKLENGIEFQFHGRGCRIWDSRTWVDFDFLPDGKLDGFDAWRLYWFIEENQLEDPVPTLEEIKTGLEHLQTIGAIVEVGASGMFRIRDRGNSRPGDISMT